MPTKLSRFADGIMEAAWLAALIIVPLFFNVYSSRIFEPDKITILRTLALVILAAWAVKLFEEGRLRRPELSGLSGRLLQAARLPLALPVSALAFVTILSTLFSVTPYTSFWGSYQRLQGTYTTAAYLILFAALAANLRRREQIERLIVTAIFTSLPVSLYGVLQRYQADPIPWGGDVTVRIAANLGNSIFVAAYLIMVFPLTLMRIVEAFDALIRERGHNGANFARATIYVFILALQSIALYFSGSRGPWLGWAAGLVLLWLGLSLLWRRRWMVISGVALALAAGAFLVVLNIPGGPLENLRSRPEFGRLGQLLDAESRTGRVRTLIWRGAYELVRPHTPLEYPDGRPDAFNAIRPLIGYGPESMYVAYNRFYQPELTRVEKRNASPDRSHNETWDSLVITGLFGLAVYLALFGSVIYYGLKWLGLIRGDRQRNLFISLYLLSGALVAAFFWWWRGPAYFGVALPFGMVFGLLVYLIVAALAAPIASERPTVDLQRSNLLLGLVAAVVAHFVEINFGIAIAATRVHFWVYAASILLVGIVLPGDGQFDVAGPDSEAASNGDNRSARPADPVAPDTGNRRTASRKKRASAARSAAARPASQARQPPAWLAQAATAGLLSALVIGVLGYLYISNASRETSALALIGDSLTNLTSKGGGRSFGLAALLLTTWLSGCLLLGSEAIGKVTSPATEATATWLKLMVVVAGVSVVAALIFWLWHAAGLAALNRVAATNIALVMGQVVRSERLLTRFYTFLFLVVFGAGVLLAVPAPAGRRTAVGWVAAIAAIGAALLIGAITNLRVIQADITFKTGEVFAHEGTWPVAIEIYDRARNLAPNEDYYYLFLGRAYLEHAKTIQDASERDRLISAAAADLAEAQRINPLNTDHTANLARLFSLWSSFANVDADRTERAATANAYFASAVSLSPNNARLWDEWAAHEMNNRSDLDSAADHLQRALEIDPFYDWTYALLGDRSGRSAAAGSDISAEEKQAALIQAAEYYTTAVSYADPSNRSQLSGYLLSYGSTMAQAGNLSAALTGYERALQVWPDNPERWRVEAALAQIYAQLGNTSRALEYVQQAYPAAPEAQKPAIADLIQQYGGQP